MSETPRADFWFSIAVTVLGVAVVAESLRMPRLENLGVHPMSAPGLTPGLIGLVLAGLGAALLLRNIKVRAQAAATATVPEPEAGSGRRLAISMALCLVYAIVLLGWLPFWLATAVFVFAFVLTFTWQRHAAMRLAAIAAVLAVAVAAAVTLLFERVFLVHLP